ncbi:MAG: COX15/CtaA family protein [Acidimicrobiales bacterium]
MTRLRAIVDTPVTPARYLRLTRAALWSLTIIVVTGGAVRLTGSGLGCSDWPNCEEDRLVSPLEYHAMIEFVNRMFTGVVTVAVVAAVLGSLRRMPRRQDLVWWSWGLVAGVLAQIILGAVLVKTDLDPRFTMGHFLLSMVLLWNATVLMHRAGRTGGRAAAGGTTPWVRAVSGLGAVLLLTGTIVTGSGPHSGSDEPEVAARLPFLVRDVTRIHSLCAIVVLALVLATARRLHEEGRPNEVRSALSVAGLLVVQGVVGYTQYFTGVPVVLVAVHITLASLTWIAIVRLHLQAVPAARRSPPRWR